LVGCFVNRFGGFFSDFAGVRTIRAVWIGGCEACVLGEVLGLIVSGGVRNSCFCSPDVGGEGPFQIWNSGDWDLELVG
jgi:hypothetical protein